MHHMTWQRCIKAADDWIASIECLIANYPEDGDRWQRELAIARAKREEFIILAEERGEQ